LEIDMPAYPTDAEPPSRPPTEARTGKLGSYSDIFGISHDREYEERIEVGDLVRCGPNLFPHFKVLAIHGDKAWVRNISNGTDSIAIVTRCRTINGQPLSLAAH
jgi:hypothetical protein